jgi:RNA polymerase sigma factor (sigma-70 family)
MLGIQKPTDQEVLEKIKQGDQKMLLFLYKRNVDPVRSYIIRNNGNTADVEDMLQEALVILWQNAQKAEFVLSSKLDTYLYAIAKNLWLKQLRKGSRMSYSDFESDHAPEMADTTEEYNDDKFTVLAKYMHQLGETCKTLLSFFYFEQWDMVQIAEKMQFANADTAKAKKYQCKKKLELLIKQHYTAEELL